MWLLVGFIGLLVLYALAEIGHLHRHLLRIERQLDIPPIWESEQSTEDPER